MLDTSLGHETLPQELVEGALESCRDRALTAQAQIDHWQEVLTRLTEEARLLEDLLKLRKNGVTRESASLRTDEFLRDRKRHSSVERTVLLLGEAGRPLHISELMRILKEEGVQVPGAGTQANLIAHLSRDPRIFRPARGMYGLAIWDIAASLPRPVTQRKKRRAKRRTRAKNRS
jgi:hypothetical protein